MVHPAYKVVNEGAPLPTSLTPVYPAGEGLSQPILRRAIGDAMKRVDWTDTLPPTCAPTCSCPISSRPCACCTIRRRRWTNTRWRSARIPAWTRVKFDELLAQQLSLKRAQRARRSRGAAALSTVGALSFALPGGAAVQADRRAAARAQ
jgi:ATP-dependent DNA helicase RecG